MSLDMKEAAVHPFVARPHKTMVVLSLPILISLIAEPLTGLADTAFIARLGTAPLAALGVGTVMLSSIFWVFNFLGIGTQTEIARSLGSGRTERARELCGLALVMGASFGVILILLGMPISRQAAGIMGAEGLVQDGAQLYLSIRLFGLPALLMTTVSFGAMRGLQDMKTPLWIAVSVNAVNIVLDAIFIFGAGPIPPLGIAGAAWATVASHWLGAGLALLALKRNLGFPSRLHGRDVRLLIVIGRDLFVRTGLLTTFLLLTTRAATRIGTEAGAAHQAIRQVWLLAALILDAFAATAQSLVGYFLGARRVDLARRVAAVSCWWSLGTGVVICAAMLMGEGAVARALVPIEAREAFAAAWLAAAIFQPLNALSFATDGIHWGTSDYRYLRNAMAAATVTGAVALLFIDPSSSRALTLVWIITGVWIFIRTVLGMGRIWPGIGNSPLSVINDEPAS
jgi:MATE family multidrug resistance protein